MDDAQRDKVIDRLAAADAVAPIKLMNLENELLTQIDSVKRLAMSGPRGESHQARVENLCCKFALAKLQAMARTIRRAGVGKR